MGFFARLKDKFSLGRADGLKRTSRKDRSTYQTSVDGWRPGIP
jgi:hypothetical protein